MGNEDEDSLNDLNNMINILKGIKSKKPISSYYPEDEDDNIFDTEFKKHFKKNYNKKRDDEDEEIDINILVANELSKYDKYDENNKKKNNEPLIYPVVMDIRDVSSHVFEYFDNNFDRNYSIFNKKIMIQEHEDIGSGNEKFYKIKKALSKFKNSFFFKIHKIEFVKRYQYLSSIIKSGDSFILDKDVNKLIFKLKNDEVFVPDNKTVIKIDKGNFESNENAILEILLQDSVNLDFTTKNIFGENSSMELDTISYVLNGFLYSDYQKEVDINKIKEMIVFLFEIKKIEGIRRQISNTDAKVFSNVRDNYKKESELGMVLSDLEDICQKGLKNISKNFINAQDEDNIFKLFVDGFFKEKKAVFIEKDDKSKSDLEDDKYEYKYRVRVEFNDNGKKNFEKIDENFLSKKELKEVYLFMQAVNGAAFDEEKTRSEKIDELVSFICYKLISQYDNSKKIDKDSPESKELLLEIEHFKNLFKENETKIEKMFAHLSICEGLTINDEKKTEIFSFDINLEDFRILSGRFGAGVSGENFFTKEIGSNLVFFVKADPKLKEFFVVKNLMQNVFQEYKIKQGKIGELIDMFLKEELLHAKMRLLDNTRGANVHQENRVRNKI